MTGSYIPAFIDALLDALNAVTWPGNTPQIVEGPWDLATSNAVIVGGTAESEGESFRDWFAFDPSMMETFTVDVTLVAGQHSTAADARRAVFAYFDALWDAVQTATAVSGGWEGIVDSDVLETIGLDVRQPEHFPATKDERGFECRVMTGIRVRARLTVPT